MKAKVRFENFNKSKRMNLIVQLENYESDKYGFSFDCLTKYQRKKLENYFGKVAAYYTAPTIIKRY